MFVLMCQEATESDEWEVFVHATQDGAKNGAIKYISDALDYYYEENEENRPENGTLEWKEIGEGCLESYSGVLDFNFFILPREVGE